MMHEEHIQRLKTAQKAVLSPMEREEMRRNIRDFMMEYPVRPTLFERLFGDTQASPIPVFYFRPALAGLLIFVLVGSGTSYAAADALPGDFLYPIKTAVNENVQGAFTFSEEGKANLNAKLAVRRLEEAETLASEGRLSPEIRADIEARFEKHAEKFEMRVTSLADNDATIELAADAQSDLEASLKVHAAVLTELSVIVPEIEKDISPIAKIVERRARSIESGRIATEHTISRKSGRGIESAATVKKRAVEKELSSRTASSARAPAPETATMMAMEAAPAADMSASTSSDKVLDEFQAGSEKFEEGKYGEAFARFQNAIRAAKKEKLETDVRNKLNIEFQAVFENASERNEDQGWDDDEPEDEHGDDDSDESRAGGGSLPVIRLGN